MLDKVDTSAASEEGPVWSGEGHWIF